jgi:hypothetical protein
MEVMQSEDEGVREIGKKKEIIEEGVRSNAQGFS